MLLYQSLKRTMMLTCKDIKNWKFNIIFSINKSKWILNNKNKERKDKYCEHPKFLWPQLYKDWWRLLSPRVRWDTEIAQKNVRHRNCQKNCETQKLPKKMWDTEIAQKNVRQKLPKKMSDCRNLHFVLTGPFVGKRLRSTFWCYH
jgi:hypothetical protein